MEPMWQTDTGLRMCCTQVQSAMKLERWLTIGRQQSRSLRSSEALHVAVQSHSPDPSAEGDNQRFSTKATTVKSLFFQTRTKVCDGVREHSIDAQRKLETLLDVGLCGTASPSAAGWLSLSVFCCDVISPSENTIAAVTDAIDTTQWAEMSVGDGCQRALCVVSHRASGVDCHQVLHTEKRWCQATKSLSPLTKHVIMSLGGVWERRGVGVKRE